MSDTVGTKDTAQESGDWCAECSRHTSSYTHQELCATGIAASENAREKVRAMLSAQKEKP